MQTYETLLITKPNLEKDAMAGLVKKITTTISKNGGEPIRTVEWGNKRLAYEIKKFREGYYVLFEFGGAGDTVRKVEDYLNLQTDVIRYLTTRKVKKAAAAGITPIRAAAPEPRPATPAVAPKPAVAVAEPAPEPVPAPVAEPVPAPVAKAKAEVEAPEKPAEPEKADAAEKVEETAEESKDE